MRLEEKAQKEYFPTVRSLPTALLFDERNREAEGEIVWRFGSPLSALTLALMAIPLAFVNPRAGRSVNLMLAGLSYLVYNNALSIVQAWVSQGKIAFVAGLVGPHLLVLAIVIFLFYRRLSVSPLLRLLRRRA